MTSVGVEPLAVMARRALGCPFASGYSKQKKTPALCVVLFLRRRRACLVVPCTASKDGGCVAGWGLQRSVFGDHLVTLNTVLRLRVPGYKS